MSKTTRDSEPGNGTPSAGSPPDVDRQFSPSAARNRRAIGDVFVEHMPHAGKILEIASGSGEHVIHLARRLPAVHWLPGDPDPAARRSIRAWIAHSALANIAQPHATDAAAVRWPVENEAPLDGMVSINMIHITPFGAARGLFAGAGRLLRPGGGLFLYGPFSRHGRHTAPSNAAFDASLKSRDPRWGVRDLDVDILPLAESAGLLVEQVVAMPSNNYAVVFTKYDGTGV
jgi:SAM-dependent methyltransferase